MATTVKDYEQKVHEVEGLRITVRRPLSLAVIQYLHPEKASDSMTIAEFIKTRLWPFSEEDVVIHSSCYPYKASPTQTLWDVRYSYHIEPGETLVG